MKKSRTSLIRNFSFFKYFESLRTEQHSTSTKKYIYRKQILKSDLLKDLKDLKDLLLKAKSFFCAGFQNIY